MTRSLTVPMTHVEAPLVEGRVQLSAAATQLLLESHTVHSRVFLMNTDGSRGPRVPLISGTTTCDEESTVRRSASVVVLGRWSDASLTPFGNRLQVQRGVQISPTVIEWCTLLTGPIQEGAQGNDDPGLTELTLPLKDEMQSITEDRFDANTSTDPTETVSAAITRLIRRTLPSATIYDSSGALGQTLCGKLDMQKDPAAGLAKLAESIGCELFTGRGWQEFILRPVTTLDDPPRWTVTAGPRGNMIAAPRKRTRDGVFNRVFAYGETNDATAGGTSTPPPSGEAVISDSTDPAVYGGPFGRKTRFYSSPLLKTNAQCVAAATALLAKARGNDTEISFTTLVHPGLDGGDRLDASLTDGTRMRQIVKSATVPLSAADLQAVAARGLKLPDETAQAS